LQPWRAAVQAKPALHGAARCCSAGLAGQRGHDGRHRWKATGLPWCH